MVDLNKYRPNSINNHNICEIRMESEDKDAGLNAGFVDLQVQLPEVLLNPRYATTFNFTGRILHGYNRKTVVASKRVAQALAQIQKDVSQLGYNLVIYDAYRPQKAVDHYCEWAKDPLALSTKLQYFPYIDKEAMIPMHYLAEQCPHSRGCAVDVSLIRKQRSLIPNEQMVAKEITYNGRSILYLSDGTEFMGTHFDFFDEASHLDTALIGEEASANRKILRKVMSQNGFLEYDKEWWHYEFENESHPDTYFDFDII